MSDRARLPLRKDYGSGVFRRRIIVETRPRHAVAELEDDFHRFRVEVEFAGARVAGIRGESGRFPWTTCPAASAALGAFVGAEVQASLPALARLVDPDRQCTHQLDLACLAIAGTALGFSRRRYDATVPELRDGRTRVALSVDDVPRLAWSLAGMKIVAPEPFSDRRLGGGFAEWVESGFEPERAIEAHVLRRATFIGYGRQYDFDAMPDPVEFAAATRTRCHSFHAENVGHAERVVGSALRFDDRPDALLRGSRGLDGV